MQKMKNVQGMDIIGLIFFFLFFSHALIRSRILRENGKYIPNNVSIHRGSYTSGHFI